MAKKPIVIHDLIAGATVNGAWHTWPGGPGAFWVSCASWNNATVTLELRSGDGTTGVPVDPPGFTNTTFTSNASGRFEIPAGAEYRASVTDAVPLALVYAKSGKLFDPYLTSE